MIFSTHLLREEMMKSRSLFIFIFIFAVFGAPASFGQSTDVMKTIRQFVDGFNKGDVKSAVAACSEQTSIIDEFPPHEWHGANACEIWANDYDADAKKNGITDGVVNLGKPKHLDVNGDVAFAVIPSDYIYKKKGKLIKQMGSAFTFALRKEASGWKITGWSWATN